MERAFVPAKSLGIAGDKQRHQSASPKAKQDGENQWQLATVGIDGGTDDHVIGPPPIRNGAALDIYLIEAEQREGKEEGHKRSHTARQVPPHPANHTNPN